MHYLWPKNRHQGQALRHRHTGQMATGDRGPHLPFRPQLLQTGEAYHMARPDYHLAKGLSRAWTHFPFACYLLPTLIVRVDQAIVDQAIKEQERTARTEGEEQRQRLRRRPYNVVDEADAVLARAQAAGGAVGAGESAVGAGESAVERVILTMDDATLPTVENIAAILHAQGFAVGIERA